MIVCCDGNLQLRRFKSGGNDAIIDNDFSAEYFVSKEDFQVFHQEYLIFGFSNLRSYRNRLSNGLINAIFMPNFLQLWTIFAIF